MRIHTPPMYRYHQNHGGLIPLGALILTFEQWKITALGAFWLPSQPGIFIT
jgi:hypothetical protein